MYKLKFLPTAQLDRDEDRRNPNSHKWQEEKNDLCCEQKSTAEKNVSYSSGDISTVLHDY